MELKLRRQPVAAFHFRYVFFDKNASSQASRRVKTGLTREEQRFVERYDIRPLSSFVRMNYTLRDKIRSKLIVRPEYVHINGIHFIWKEVKGSRLAWVKPEVGLLHHYRTTRDFSVDQSDFLAFRFKDELIARLKVRFAAMPEIFSP